MVFSDLFLLNIFQTMKCLSSGNIKSRTRNNEVALMRACSAGYLEEKRLSNTSSRSFLNDANHIWNQAPIAIKSCSTIYSAKKAIKSFILLLQYNLYLNFNFFS